MSKLPLRRIVSHQTEPDQADGSKRVFGRDLLQIDVYTPTGTKRLFTVFNTHMKSNFVDKLKHRTPISRSPGRQGRERPPQTPSRSHRRSD